MDRAILPDFRLFRLSFSIARPFRIVAKIMEAVMLDGPLAHLFRDSDKRSDYETAFGAQPAAVANVLNPLSMSLGTTVATPPVVDEKSAQVGAFDGPMAKTDTTRIKLRRA
jgi:hypothetical protein